MYRQVWQVLLPATVRRIEPRRPDHQQFQERDGVRSTRSVPAAPFDILLASGGVTREARPFESLGRASRRMSSYTRPGHLDLFGAYPLEHVSTCSRAGGNPGSSRTTCVLTCYLGLPPAREPTTDPAPFASVERHKGRIPARSTRPHWNHPNPNPATTSAARHRTIHPVEASDNASERRPIAPQHRKPSP